MKKILSLLVAVVMLVSLASVGALASGEASGEPNQRIVLKEDDALIQSGVEFEGDSGYLYLKGGAAMIGGEDGELEVEPVLPVTAKYFDASAVELDGAYDSVFVDTNGPTSGSNMFHATGTESFLDVRDVYIRSQGSQTAAMYADSNNNTVVISDSYLESVGSVEGYEDVNDFMALQGLLVWGHTRTNLSQGYTNTYYYNSAVVADGWAAMSTDGAQGLGVNFVAVNSYAETTDGGYAIYSDHECRDYIFGTTLVGAEYGAIIASGGELYLFDGDAIDVGTTELNGWREAFLGAHTVQLAGTSYQDFAGEHPVYALEEYWGEAAPEIGASQLIGGRNSILVHKPDEAHVGKGADDQNVFSAIGSELITDYTLFNLEDMPSGWYTPDCVTSSASFFKNDTLNYVKWTSGPAILIRSCSTLIDLDEVTFTSNYDEAGFGQAGTFIMSVLNSDGNANLIADGDIANPMDISIRNSEITGDIQDYDYQRAMQITLDGATLTGAIVSHGVDEWNAIWGENGSVGTGDYAYDAAYANEQGASVELVNGAVWNVTAESVLDNLTVDATSTVNGVVTETADGYIVTPLGASAE